MVLIDFTNIIVDDFNEAKQRPYSKFIHFLTHMHTDHFNGLSDGWDLGMIYCSKITGDMLSFRFPRLEPLIRRLELNTEHIIPLNDENNLTVHVTLFDANHCAGSVMLLFQGYFGRVLHTGDIRYDREKFQNYYSLYPYNLRNPEFVKCSKPIDVLYLDNTFCDPVFNFPTKQAAIKEVFEWLRQIGKRRIYVGLDNVGKEQLLIQLATKCQTLVIVDDCRYKNIVLMGYNYNYFTTNIQEGWIRVVKKKELRRLLKEDPNAIGLVPTGWCNHSYFDSNSRIMFIPYSLHSNYRQLEEFVKSINPANIIPIVRSFSKLQKIEKDTEDDRQNWKSVYELAKIVQNGLEKISQYKGGESASFTQIKNNVELQTLINKKIRIVYDEEERKGTLKQYALKEREVMEKARKSRTGSKLNVNVNMEEVENARKLINLAVEKAKQRNIQDECMIIESKDFKSANKESKPVMDKQSEVNNSEIKKRKKEPEKSQKHYEDLLRRAQLPAVLPKEKQMLLDKYFLPVSSSTASSKNLEKLPPENIVQLD